MAAPPGFNGRTEMFKDEVTAVGNAAKGKINLLEHNFTGYIMMSLLAGLYIALGSILMGIVGGVFYRGRFLCDKGWPAVSSSPLAFAS